MASWYRKVDVRMWGDRKFRGLSKPQPNAQTLFLYLLTGPHTEGLAGLAMAGERGLAEGLGWDLEAFRYALAEALAEGMVLADWEARVVFVPNAIRYNKPESVNVVKSWVKIFDKIPESVLKENWVFRLNRYFETEFEGHQAFGHAFREAFGDGFGYALPDALLEALPLARAYPQPQPQPQPKEEKERRAVRPAIVFAWIEIVEFLNLKAAKNFGVAKTVSHRRLIEALFKSGYSADQMRAVIEDRVREWGNDPRMNKNLRPSTIFNKTNFENYLGLVGTSGATVLDKTPQLLSEAKIELWDRWNGNASDAAIRDWIEDNPVAIRKTLNSEYSKMKLLGGTGFAV
jgi:uncharacterized phage protein (TIGR02220 family)